MGSGVLQAAQLLLRASVPLCLQACDVQTAMASDKAQTIVFVASKSAPYSAVAGVQILLPDEMLLQPATTDEDGVCVIRHRTEGDAIYNDHLRLRVVHPVTQSVLHLPAQQTGLLWNTVATHSPKYKWLLFDDRKLYKPCETVYLKGYLRQLSMEGQLELVECAGTVCWEVCLSGQKIGEGKVSMSERCSFDCSCLLPAEKVGTAQLKVHLESDKKVCHSHSFEIKEFKTPEYNVFLSKVEAAGRHQHYVVGNKMQIKMAASYYSGGPLAASTATYDVSNSVAEFSPPGHSEFCFSNGACYSALLYTTLHCTE